MAEVCFVTKGWRAGAAWVAQNVAQATAEAGCKVTYIAPLAEPLSREPIHPNLKRIIVPREIIDSGRGRVARVFASLTRIFIGIGAVLKERSSTRTFLFSIPDPLIFTLPLFVLLRSTGARVILLVHDVVPHAWRLPPRLRWLERGAHGLSYRLSGSLVVMTTALKSALVREFGIDPQKIHIIPHGVFQVGEIASLPGSGKLLQFGKIRSNKNVLEVIRGVMLARAMDPAIVLTIAGEPHPHERDYWAACQAEIAKDPVGFDLRIGFFKDEEIPALVGNADAFMLAYENFDSQSGVGVIAGLCGRPVIGTHSGGLSELFAGGMCGVYVAAPVTAEHVCEAIAAFRARPVAEWREAGARGAESLKDALSWARIGVTYRNLVAANETFMSPGHQVS